MPPNTAADQVRIAQQAQAWGYRQKGWAQTRIAEKLGIDQSTVSRWLDTIERRELARLSKRVEGQKVRQTAILELIVDESLQAWERSKAPKKRASQKTAGGGLKGPDGKPLSTTQTDATERDGDPIHLATAMTALAHARRLWGLDAPARAELKTDRGGGPSVAEVMQRLKANASKHDSETPSE